MSCLEFNEKRYFNFIYKKIEMELDLSKHMWNLEFSTQSNDVQAFHFLPKNEIWIIIIWNFYMKNSRYLTIFQLGLQVSWTIMCIYVKKIVFFFFAVGIILNIFLIIH
jgi:hypothetical protein